MHALCACMCLCVCCICSACKVKCRFQYDVIVMHWNLFYFCMLTFSDETKISSIQCKLLFISMFLFSYREQKQSEAKHIELERHKIIQTKADSKTNIILSFSQLSHQISNYSSINRFKKEILFFHVFIIVLKFGQLQKFLSKWFGTFVTSIATF